MCAVDWFALVFALVFIYFRFELWWQDCGHQNPKQKIHKMLQIEVSSTGSGAFSSVLCVQLENLDLRKENFELRTRLVNTVQTHYRRLEFEEPINS